MLFTTLNPKFPGPLGPLPPTHIGAVRRHPRLARTQAFKMVVLRPPPAHISMWAFAGLAVARPSLTLVESEYPKPG